MADPALRLRTRLARCGVALYGERWQVPLSRALGVSDRSVRAWIAGTRSIPEGVWAEVRALLNQRSGECAALVRELGG
jgi:hypothetical protein